MSIRNSDAQGLASLLRECAKKQDYAEGNRVYQQIIASPRHCHDRFLRNLAITMFGSCGRIDDAIRVFDCIPKKNLFTWSSMISAFAKNGHLQQAMDLYTEMVYGSGLQPDSVVFVAVLSAVSSLHALRELHAQIIAAGIHGETKVGTAIVNAYGRFGGVDEAVAAFEEIAYKDVVAWNSIIAVASQHGELDRAKELYRRMGIDREVEPDNITLASLLDGCGSVVDRGDRDRDKDLEVGRFVDEESVRRGLRGDVAVQNALIRMYGRCRRVELARAVFEKMSFRNLASWNAIVVANAHCGCRAEAIEALEVMIGSRAATPDRTSFSVLLDSCCCSEHLDDGVRIHGLISSAALEEDIIVMNSLISMYGRCGSAANANAVFATIKERDLVSWTAAISAHAANGQLLQAKFLYLFMIQEGVLPDRVTYATLLAGCLKKRALDPGIMIHNHMKILYGSSLDEDNVLGSHLINFYRRCDSLEDAKALFDRMIIPDASCWSAMIASYAQNGHRSQALGLFQRMKSCGILPDRMGLVSVLGVCWSIDQARGFHSWIRSNGLDRDRNIATALIQMYGRLGCVEESKIVFDRLNDVDPAVWTSLIQAYARNDRPREALDVFAVMIQDDRCNPDAASFASAMDACGELKDLELARKIHTKLIESSTMMEIVVGNAAIAMYGRCRSLEEAKTTFDRMKTSVNTATFNAMIGAYTQNGHPAAGLEIYQQMKKQGFHPDRITLVLALDAVAQASSGVDQVGLDILDDAAVDPDERVATAVIGMLSGIGKTNRAKKVFDAVPQRDGICWSAMVALYAQNGHSLQALELFSTMVNEGYVADRAVIVSVLAACSQCGDFRRARVCFTSMQADFAVDPAAEHYACMVDLLSRVGRVRESQELSREMPFKADKAAAMALLAGSGFDGGTNGILGFNEDDIKASLHCAAPYVLLSNIYKQSSR